jgi:proline iminopeptidase
MQGLSELGTSGKLADGARMANLAQIEVPTLVIGARHDTMDPSHMEWMAGAVRRRRYLYCSDGSHLALYDDQTTYFRSLVEFIRDVRAGHF